jgi:porin
VQGIDNYEAVSNGFRLYEAWVDQSFFDEKLSVLVGVHDINSDLSVTNMTLNFIKPTFQYGQVLAGAGGGGNGPSTYPYTSYVARTTLKPTDETYLSLLVADALPDSRNKLRGTHVSISRRDGLILFSEIGYTPKVVGQEDAAPNKIAIGGWTFTKKQDDLVDVDGNGDAIKKRMSGAYFLSSYQFYNEEKSGRRLGAFFRAGLGESDTLQVNWDYVAGVVANGWVRSRPQGEFGLGVSQAQNSEKYLRSVSNLADKNEYGFELYYRDEISNGVTIQPDVQYTLNHGTDTIAKNATIVALRVGLNF